MILERLCRYRPVRLHPESRHPSSVSHLIVHRLYVKHNLDLDSLVKESCLASVFVPAMLDMHPNLLGVKFVEVTIHVRDIWHLSESFAMY